MATEIVKIDIEQMSSDPAANRAVVVANVNGVTVNLSLTTDQTTQVIAASQVTIEGFINQALGLV